METEIRTSSQFKTAGWSGGQTTELYIFPADGDYGRRDFLIRISSATVETEDSRFTKLPGIRRELMILDGEIKLIHEGRRSRMMKPYDVDSFLGGWETRSHGTSKTVRDFNLMAREDMETCMTFELVEAEKEFSWNEERFAAGRQKEGREHKIAVYIIEGQGRAGDCEVKASRLIVISHYSGETVRFENTGDTPMKMAVCQILL